MGVFKCIHTGEKYVLNADMSIECMTPEHNAWMEVGVLQMIVYGLGIPIGIAYLLRRANLRKDIDGGLDNEKTKAALGFVYEGYSKNCYAWECLIMLRKAILAMVVTACKDSPFYQTFFAAMLLQAYTYVHLQFRPYRDKVEKDANGNISKQRLEEIKKQKSLQVLETTSLCITTITLSGAVMFFSHPPPSWKELKLIYQTEESLGAWDGVPLGVSITLFVLNVALIVRFAMAFINTFLEHKDTIKKELAKSTYGLSRMVSTKSTSRYKLSWPLSVSSLSEDDTNDIEMVDSTRRIACVAASQSIEAAPERLGTRVTSNPMYESCGPTRNPLHADDPPGDVEGGTQRDEETAKEEVEGGDDGAGEADDGDGDK